MDLPPVVRADTPFQALSQAFIMIVVSEIGDKTFLIAAIMATRHPRLTVFSGAFASLMLMSVLSAALGKVVLGLIPKRWTEWVAALLFLAFGVRMLQEGLAIPAGSGHMQDEMREVEDELDDEDNETGRAGGGGEKSAGLSGRVLFDAEEGRGANGRVGSGTVERRSSGDVVRLSTGDAGVGLGIVARDGRDGSTIAIGSPPLGGSDLLSASSPGLDGGAQGQTMPNGGKRKTPSISPNRHAMAFNAAHNSHNHHHPLSAPNGNPSSSNPFAYSNASSSSTSPSLSRSSRTPFTSFLLSLRHKIHQTFSSGGSTISLPSISVGGASSKSTTTTSALDPKRLKQSVKNLMGLFFSPVFVQAFVLTFLGEWGDRSQIATIALGGANSVAVVAFGTIIGHGLCTAGAVIGGRYLSTKISIRHITLLGAVAFLVFACIYAYEGWNEKE